MCVFQTAWYAGSFMPSLNSLKKQLFSTMLSSQFTHYSSAHREKNLPGDIILCINNPNWASKSLCKHLRILGKHRAVIIVIYPLSVVII